MPSFFDNSIVFIYRTLQEGCVNMDWIQELTQKESLCCSLDTFLDQHGFSGLEKALWLYSNTQAEIYLQNKSGRYQN